MSAAETHCPWMEVKIKKKRSDTDQLVFCNQKQ